MRGEEREEGGDSEGTDSERHREEPCRWPHRVKVFFLSVYINTSLA